MNIGSVTKHWFRRLIKSIVIHHGIVAMLCIMYFLFIRKKSVVLSTPLIAVLLFLAICFGLFSGIDQRRRIRKHISLMQKSGDETKKVNIPLNTLPIMNMLVLDLVIIPILVQNSAHIISLLIALGCNGFVVYLTAKLMPHVHKNMQGDTMECKGDVGNMVYAVGAINQLNYLIGSGTLGFFGGVFLMIYRFWLPIIGETVLSYESLCLYVLLTLLSVMIGIALGYIQNNIQYKEVMWRTDQLAEIKKAQEDFPRYGLQVLALYTTRSFMCYFVITILDLLVFFVLLTRGAFRLSIVPLFIGFVYTVSSLLWWRLSHRKRITRAPGFKTSLDI